MRLVVSILLQICAVATLAAQPALQSRSGDLGVVPSEHGPRVRDDLGHSNPLNIAEDVDLFSLVQLRGGWLAAGVQPVGARRELYLRMLDPGGLKRLPVPTGQRAAIRHQPVLLAEDGTIEGILWLEGDGRESLAVKASRWLGITWSAPVTVAPVGPGSQLALDAVVLPDGSWLAVWSAFDGEDDEVLWSIGVDGSWTDPQPMSDNSVPDILPTVVPCKDGAMLAWNQFDGGEYRVVTARLLEGRWVPGWREDRGTLYPRLFQFEEGPALLFYSLSDRGREWRLRQYDQEGTLTRSGRTATVDSSQPLLLRSGNAITLEWPETGGKRRIVWERGE